MKALSQTENRAKKKKKRRNDPLLIFACVLGIAVLIAIGIILRSMNRQNTGTVTGWHITNGNTYYVDAITKKPATGLNTIGNKVYYFQPDGFIKAGWADYEGEKIYVQSDGIVATGECEIDGELYSFAFDTYKMLKDSYVEQSNGKAFYFGPDGKAVKNKICSINGNERYFDEEGLLVRSDWITTLEDEDAFYYADKDGILVTGKVNIQGQTHYFLENHKAATGKMKVDGVEYNFDSRGYDSAMNPVVTTPAVTTAPSVTTVPSTSVTSAPVTTKPDVKSEGWREVNGKKQYIFANGSAAKGAVKIEDVLYIFNESGELNGAGWKEINGNRYYSDENGKAKIGFADIDGKTYYFDSTGKTLRGVQNINGAVYNLSDSGEVTKNQFVEMNGHTYYFDDAGKRAIGFKEINGEAYYFSETRSIAGQMQYKYIKVGSSEYYMDPNDGHRVTGWVVMGNCKYYFSPVILKNGSYDIGGTVYTFNVDGALLDEDGYPVIVE